MSTQTDKPTTTASATPEVYASQDVPGNFGFIGCDSDQYQTREAAEAAAQRTIPAEKPTAFPLHLEQANGQTTIYDAKLNVLFRVDGRYFDELNPIVTKANHADKLAEALRQAREALASIEGKARTMKIVNAFCRSDNALAAYESEVRQ